MLPKECGNCGGTEDLHMHHVVPLSSGGRNVITNLVRLCNDCHSAAHGGFSLLEKGREALDQRVASGRNGAGRVPLGYDLLDGRYVINEDSAELVRFIYRLRYESEYGAGTITNILNYMAIPTKRNSSEWSHPAVLRILSQRKYLGERYHLGEYLDNNVPAILDEDMIAKITRFDAKYKDSQPKPVKWTPHSYKAS